MPADLVPYVLAFLIGVLTGFRSRTPIAMLSFAPLPFLQGYSWVSYLLVIFALAELVGDKLPKTPSRKTPVPFGFRILFGGLCGFALCAYLIPGDLGHIGLIAGVAGAVAGTLGGYQLRMRLVRAIGGTDWPIALLEDIVTIGGSWLILARFLTAET